MFLLVPFERSQKTLLEEEAHQVADALLDTLADQAILVKKRAGFTAADRFFRGLEDVPVEIQLSMLEAQCLELSLRETIREDRLCPRASSNVYFGGDPYGITPSDFKSALEKIRAVMARENYEAL
ncbi:MAG: hypothetical protein AAF725_08665 [Acidobacteriota bacterium]